MKKNLERTWKEGLNLIWFFLDRLGSTSASPPARVHKLNFRSFIRRTLSTLSNFGENAALQFDLSSDQ